MRVQRLLFALAIVLCTARCGTLFNQQRSDTATSAQKKFSDVKLVDLLQEERKHNAEILAREIAVAQRQMLAARDAKLIAIVSKPDLKAALDMAVKERLTLLQGGDPTIAALLLKIDDQEEALRADTAVYLIARTRTDPKPDCSPNNLQVSPGATDFFDMVEGDCSDLAKSRATLATRTNAGLLGSTAQAIAATERARIDVAGQLKKAEEQALLAVKDVAATQKNARGLLLDAGALAALRERVDKLMLPAPNDFGGIGLSDVRLAAALRWAEIQKAAVEKVLATATAGAAAPPSSLDGDLQIAALLPTLAGQLRDGARYPRVSGLVMEAQRLRIEGDRYRRQLARVDEELELQRAKLRRLRLEWELLSETTSQLNAGKTEVALQKYTESWTSGRVPLTVAEWKLIGLTHDRALDQSEAALAQWEGLVRTPLEALVASTGSGLKSAEIARLLQTLELSALTLGVF
jgi:hypothetical protein